MNLGLEALPIESPVIWITPPPGILKINIDAAFSGKSERADLGIFCVEIIKALSNGNLLIK